MENLLDNVKCKLKHVVLVTGTKHYMGPFELIAKGQADEVDSPYRVRILPPDGVAVRFSGCQYNPLFDLSRRSTQLLTSEIHAQTVSMKQHLGNHSLTAKGKGESHTHPSCRVFSDNQTQTARLPILGNNPL